MTSSDKDNELIAERAKTTFDASVERLDAATLSRLNKGRHAALRELDRQHWFAGRGLAWLPVTGVAAAALVALIVIRGPDDLDVAADVVTMSDFELLLEDESLEMLEDLEFYSWLDAEDFEASGNVG